MRPRDTRKAIKELKALCKRNGITLTVEPSRGKGSHCMVFFRDNKTGETVPFAISGGKEISSGVQRNGSRYFNQEIVKLTSSAAARELASLVGKIWDSYFGG